MAVTSSVLSRSLSVLLMLLFSGLNEANVAGVSWCSSLPSAAECKSHKACSWCKVEGGEMACYSAEHIQASVLGGWHCETEPSTADGQGGGCRGIEDRQKCLAEQLSKPGETCVWCTVNGGSSEFCLTQGTAKLLPSSAFTCSAEVKHPDVALNDTHQSTELPRTAPLADMARRSSLMENDRFSMGWGPTARDPDDYVIVGKHGLGGDRPDCKKGTSFKTCPVGCTWCVDMFGHQKECLQRDAALNIPPWVFKCRQAGQHKKQRKCGTAKALSDCQQGCYWCEGPNLEGTCCAKSAALAVSDDSSCKKVSKKSAVKKVSKPVKPCTEAKSPETCEGTCFWCKVADSGYCFPEVTVKNLPPSIAECWKRVSKKGPE